MTDIYHAEAFGNFAPHRDPEAALKFILDLVFSDERLGDLIELLSPESDNRELEGDPGWLLERRASSDNGNWPSLAEFRASVDPVAYPLTYPEFFCDTATFRARLEAICNVHGRLHPECATETAHLRRLASALTANPPSS